MIFIYKCLKCDKKISLKEAKERIRCPYCGFRILIKTRPKTITHVKAI